MTAKKMSVEARLDRLEKAVQTGDPINAASIVREGEQGSSSGLVAPDDDAGAAEAAANATGTSREGLEVVEPGVFLPPGQKEADAARDREDAKASSRKVAGPRPKGGA